MLDLLLQDWSSMFISIEYIWFLFAILFAGFYLNFQYKKTHTFIVREFKSNKQVIPIIIKSFWTPPILTWFVICRCLSENSDEEESTSSFS